MDPKKFTKEQYDEGEEIESVTDAQPISKSRPASDLGTTEEEGFTPGMGQNLGGERPDIQKTPLV